MGRIVCFGELLLRLAAPGRELLLQTPRLEVHIGGAEANVAVGLASLGHACTMASCVPDNVLGEAAIGHLRRHGVDVSGVATGPGRMGLYFLAPGAGLRASQIVYDREGSSFARATPDLFEWDRLFDGASLLHLSGIIAALGPATAELAIAAAEAASKRGVTFSFDGNYRAQLWERWDSNPREILSRLISLADIFFGNHRDISLLLGDSYGGEGDQRRRESAEAAFAAFPRLGLIASTARHVDDADRHRLSARLDSRDGCAQTEEIKVAGIIDRIGAGDAFAAGIIHGLQLGRDPDWTVRSGLALTALKHSLPGDSSLFTPGDIEAFMAGELDVRR